MQYTTRTDIPPSLQNTNISPRRFHVVSAVAYLIGVPEKNFGCHYLLSTYETLEESSHARTTRTLSFVRNSLLKNNYAISKALKDNQTSIERMTDFLDEEWFAFLRTHNIELTVPEQTVVQYVIAVNRLISNHIDYLQPLFPEDINWDYLRSIFTMGEDVEKVTSITRTFSRTLSSYPFHCYLDWPIDKAYAYHANTTSDAPPVKTGNILLHDEKYLTLLYHINHDTYIPTAKEQDNHPEDSTTDFTENSTEDSTQDPLQTFIHTKKKVAVIVDCENADPYRLIAVLRNLEKSCKISREDYQKIQKIILYDDAHTADIWRNLQDYIHIPVEHEMVDRVNDHKSLVDIKMTAGACKEHYTNNVDGFLLASSDSDFWALISSLPQVKFLVLAEKDKLGHQLQATLDAHKTPYCLIDNITGEMSEIKLGVLKEEMELYLLKRLSINVNEMLEELFTKTRMRLTEAEAESFYQKYIKSLRLELDVVGNLRVVTDI